MSNIKDIGIKFLGLDKYFDKDTYYVYGLKDPRNNQINYVGITNNLKRRYQNHLSALNTKTKKISWIKNLKSNGLAPIMEILIVCHKNDAYKHEIECIKKYKEINPNLKNGTLGGEIPSIFASKALCKKICGKNIKTNEIRYFNSIKDAEVLGFKAPNISASIRSTIGTVNRDWVFVKGWDLTLLNLKINKIQNYKNPRIKFVHSIDKDGNIENFDSLKHAAIKCNKNIKTLLSAIHSKNTSANRKWFWGKNGI